MDYGDLLSGSLYQVGPPWLIATDRYDNILYVDSINTGSILSKSPEQDRTPIRPVVKLLNGLRGTVGETVAIDN